MATRELTNVDVQEREDFDRVLDDLAHLRGMKITIDIASDAEVLNSAVEFDELAVMAQAYSVEVFLSTDDPLRQELALIYGLSVISSPEPGTTSILRSPDMQTTRVRQSFEPRVHEPPALAGLEALEWAGPKIGEVENLLAPRGGAVLDPDASYSFVVAPRGECRERFLDTVEYGANWPQSPAAGRQSHRRAKSGMALGASALVVAGVVIAIAVAVMMIGLLAPSAQIVLVPETRVIASEVSFAAASQGAPYDVVIEPVIIAETIAVEATAPATGTRQVPDAAAQGMVFLTNPLSRPVTVPAGTTIFSLDGELEFLTTEDIDVPAADPFGAATFGTAVVDVSAVEAGPAGNLTTGELAGVLESGVLYQNRFPLDGGTLRTETFVTSEDLAGLSTRAEQELNSRVSTALAGEIEPGWELLRAPAAVEPIVSTFDVEPGEVVDQVSIVAELRVEAAVYSPEELERAATDELERKLSASTPEGFALLLDSMEVSAPQPADLESGAAFVMRSEATIEAYIDPALASSLSDELAGKSEASATRILDEIGGLSSYSTSYGPDWLPWEPVPRLSNRISVDIDAS